MVQFRPVRHPSSWEVPSDAALYMLQVTTSANYCLSARPNQCLDPDGRFCHPKLVSVRGVEQKSPWALADAIVLHKVAADPSFVVPHDKGRRRGTRYLYGALQHGVGVCSHPRFTFWIFDFHGNGTLAGLSEVARSNGSMVLGSTLLYKGLGP